MRNDDKDLLKLKTTLKGLSIVLNEIIKENNDATSNYDIKSIFYSKNPPTISVENYLERIIKYSKLEESTLIISLIYIDRVCDYNNIELTMNNIHRLILSALLASIKYNEDDFYSNLYYSKVGGISLNEMNNLEDDFLKKIKFNLWIDIEEFSKYQKYLYQYHHHL